MISIHRRAKGWFVTALVSTIVATNLACAADFGLGSGTTHVLLLAFVLILGATWLTVAWALPRLWPLQGRVVVRDAFGPSVFAVMSLTGQHSWRMSAGFPDVPLRRGLLVGMVVRRGWGRAVHVSLILQPPTDETHREVSVGRMEPDGRGQLDDVILHYDVGQRTSGGA